MPKAQASAQPKTTITTEIRVTSIKVQPFAYRDGKGEMVGGESMEMKAAGFWQDQQGNCYPASLHLTVYPGHGVLPAVGDCIRVSVERIEPRSPVERN